MWSDFVLRSSAFFAVGVFALAGVLPAEAGRPRAVCGNGYTQFGEECDDGNVVSGDLCSSSCELEIPAGCTEVAPLEMIEAREGDPYFQAMLFRAGDLGYGPDLLHPLRCPTATGGELYSAVMLHVDGERAVALQARDDLVPPFSAVLLELRPSPTVVLHYGDGSIVAENTGTPAESLTVLDLQGAPLAGGLGAALAAAGAGEGTGCDERLRSWAECLWGSVGPLVECSFGVFGAIGFCTTVTSSSAGLGFWVCSAFMTAGMEYLNPGACTSFMPIALACEYPIGRTCSEGPEGCASPKRCEYRSANPFDGAECLCPLEITGFDEPVVAVMNGADPGVEISWEGQPQFPVRAEYETPDCPPLWSCPPDSQTFWTETQPLVWDDALGCEGTEFALPQDFETEFVLSDAAGQRSDPRSLTWTCVAP